MIFKKLINAILGQPKLVNYDFELVETTPVETEKEKRGKSIARFWETFVRQHLVEIVYEQAIVVNWPEEWNENDIQEACSYLNKQECFCTSKEDNVDTVRYYIRTSYIPGYWDDALAKIVEPFNKEILNRAKEQAEQFVLDYEGELRNKRAVSLSTPDPDDYQEVYMWKYMVSYLLKMGLFMDRDGCITSVEPPPLASWENLLQKKKRGF